MPSKDEKQLSRVKTRYWMETDFESSPPFDKFTMTCMRVGKEICPTTQRVHWHASIQFACDVRLKTLKECFPKMHFDARKGKYSEFFAYSKKDGEFIDYGEPSHSNQGERADFNELIEAIDEGEQLGDLMRKFPKTVSRFMPYTKGLLTIRKDKIALEKRKSKFNKPFREWQSALKLIIEGEVCDRSVYWYYDAAGGKGKSFMSGYLQTHHDAFIVSGGKVADIAHAFDEQPIVCFDLSRTMVDHCDHVYSMIEKFKDGCIFSGKYESRTKIFDVPHVVVFTNFMSDQTKLSEDRWKIITI